MVSRDKQLMAAPMAADGGLRRLFEKPVPENPTLLEALSVWNHRKAHLNKSIEPASFTEIFGELHFQEKQGVLPSPSPSPAPAPEPAPSPPPRTASWLDVAVEAEKNKDDSSSLDALLRPKPASAGGVSTVKKSASFCMKNTSSASLLLCTEGLGSESTVDADDMLKDGDAEAEAAAGRVEDTATAEAEDAERRDGAGAEEAEEEKRKRRPPSFPPPIRSIGRGGRPFVCFRSFRTDGRFVLLEVVIPGKELLQATREGGRLRLQFANAAVVAGAAAAISGRVGVDEELRGGDGDRRPPSQERVH